MTHHELPIVNRFLRYISIDTQSDENSSTTPSTEKQFDLARVLKKEMEEMGLEDVSLDDHCYLMGTLPANCDDADSRPVIGFVSHMDTSPDMSGKDINPRIVQYEGGKIVLCEKEGIELDPELFPEMELYKGQEIIVTDGHTLLGADDKAGVAAIMEAMQYLIDHPEIKHGKIRIGFTPDEEIGRGADLFDVKKFGCDYAYTIDGGQIGELEYENFNAAAAKVTFQGRNVHPGSAKDKMVNAMHLAIAYDDSLPCERPCNTEGYEGFYHLIGMNGTVEEAELTYIIRDHDRKKFEDRKQMMLKKAEELNQKQGKEVVKVELRDQYYNMREIVEKEMYIVDHAYKAMETVGVKPDVSPIRGGTDGSKLSYMGLPCPNIFAGGHNFHGRYEYLPIPSMVKAKEVIVEIAATRPPKKD